ncbi:hypothetical protein [Verrucomicrobium sp. BvORR034]|jgi:hypothetical protein|uniref:hypothetical protein n=1 Tax=Verrucomicrobium sp. BvORR034 TaxID=1396418 RepID=UPI000678DE99|nr:hypothetical protein [Verrucomicrobium sp. BvORR034]
MRVCSFELATENYSSFLTKGFGTVRVGRRTNTFGFQIATTNPAPHPTLLFALRSDGGEFPVEFGIRINLATGEITDTANNSGLIGWLDPSLWPSSLVPYPLVLRWEVENTGLALIPRLIIGDEEWLYPSVHSPGEAWFTATAGHDLENAEIGAVYSPGYVWCEDRMN